MVMRTCSRCLRLPPLYRYSSTSSSPVHVSPSITPHPPRPVAVPLHPDHIFLTQYKFPSLEATKLVKFPYELLGLPLRKDLLHRAVVYELDGLRQGSANTKTRGEVRGSGKKVRPQKGTGRARMGELRSPINKGGKYNYYNIPTEKKVHKCI